MNTMEEDNYNSVSSSYSSSSSYSGSLVATTELDHLWLQAEVITAIQGLDKRERRAYQTAVDVVPDMVQAETPVVNFLRTENRNITAAAKRLAAYWKYRKLLFPERWLLPMTQTGTGTLSSREIQLLRTGYQACFNRAPNGGLLVVVDFARIGEQNNPHLFDAWVNIRVTFYLCTVLTDAMTQQHGATCVYIVRSGQLPAVDTNCEGWKILHEALPVKIQQMIVARAFVPGKEGILNYLTYQRARVNEFRSGLQPKQLIANSMQGTLALLQAKGCDRRHLPQCVGGDWDVGQFHEWIRTRISLEDVLSSAPLERTTLGGFSGGGGTRTRRRLLLPGPLPGVDMGENNNATATVLHKVGGRSSSSKRTVSKRSTTAMKCKATVKDKQTDRQRKLNALYSRRSYHKRKLEMVHLQEQIKALEMQQKILQNELQQLKTAHVQAQQLVMTYNTKGSGGRVPSFTI